MTFVFRLLCLLSFAVIAAVCFFRWWSSGGSTASLDPAVIAFGFPEDKYRAIHACSKTVSCGRSNAYVRCLRIWSGVWNPVDGKYWKPICGNSTMIFAAHKAFFAQAQGTGYGFGTRS